MEGAKVPVPSVSAQAQSSRIRRGIQPHAHNWRIEASTRGAPVRPTHLPSGAITRHSEARSEALIGTLLWAVASYGLGPSTAHSSYQAANASRASADGLPNMGSCLKWQQPSSGATTGSARRSSALPNKDGCLIWQQPSSGATTGSARRSSASSRQHRCDQSRQRRSRRRTPRRAAVRGEMRPNRRYLMRDAIRGHQGGELPWGDEPKVQVPDEGRNQRPSGRRAAVGR